MDSTQATAFSHISLCAGYGGIDLGLSRVIRGLRTIAFSEIEAFPCANLVAKMEAGLLDAAPIWTNLKTFPFSDFRGKVGIISGGFPCQPFSAAGKRGGDEDPRHLFPHILKGITECQPELVFLENVEGIVSAKLAGTGWRDPAGTPVLLHVLRELERVGYRATAGVFSSAEIGASHQRKRVFILGRKMADTSGDGGLPAQLSGQWSGSELGGSAWATRPKPPGPDQWWWEPARVVANAKSRLSGKSAQSERGQGAGSRSEAVGDTSLMQRDGGDDNARISLESGPLSQSGNTGGSGSMEYTSNEGLEGAAGTSLQGRRQGSSSSDRGYGSDQIGSTQSSLGRNSDGSPNWLDYAKLSTTVDSRVDELRLLGNGVDPAVAAKAFLTLIGRLTD